MRKIIDGIGIALVRVAPFMIILINHVRVADGGYKGWNIALIAWLLMVFFSYFLIIKPIDKKITVWEIQDRHNLFILNFRHLKLAVLAGLLWTIWRALSEQTQGVSFTLMLIFLSICVGWLFRLLAFKFDDIQKKGSN